jgi:hypothetical protein
MERMCFPRSCLLTRFGRVGGLVVSVPLGSEIVGFLKMPSPGVLDRLMADDGFGVLGNEAAGEWKI